MNSKIIDIGGIIDIILIPSHHKVKSDYLLIFMAKAKPGNKWSHITHAEKVFRRSGKKGEPSNSGRR